MTDFASHLEDYLKLRRALGFRLKIHGQILPQFVAYLDAACAPTLTAELAIAWAGLPQGVRSISLAHRLGIARGFAKYLQSLEPATEVPPCGIWRSVTRRPFPYLYSDADVHRLLEVARSLQPPLRAATYETLFGLLSASGMRIGEALALQRDDVDLSSGVLTIQDGKFRRARLVPLHPSATAALRSYTADRDRMSPRPRTRNFFISSRGTALLYRSVLNTFIHLTTVTGLCSFTSRPRIHDYADLRVMPTSSLRAGCLNSARS